MNQAANLQLATVLLQHPEVWMHYSTLAGQLSPALQIEALKAGGGLLDAMKTGTLIEALPVQWQAMFGVAMNHVAHQTPLFFSDELAIAWDGFAGGMTAYCPRDGYRVPLSITRCPVCGANTMAVEPAHVAVERPGSVGAATNIPVT